MGTCIYSKTSFNNSAGEHILQNFLGARWTSGEIVSDDLQAEFGQTIDLALEQSLRPIRNLFGTQGGRGNSGPTLKKIQVTSGEVIDLEPGGKPRLSEPIVEVNPIGNGHYNISIRMGKMEHLGWALAILRKKIPGLKVDVEMIKQTAQSAQGYLTGQIKLNLTLGGKEYFRGLLKSCFNLLGVNDPNVALSAECDSLRAFVKDGTGTIEDFVRWIPEPDELIIPKIGRADHFIGIMSIRGGIEGIAQLFGEIRHSIRIAQKYNGVGFSYGYIVNPFRNTMPAETRNPKFEKTAIPIFCEQHIKPSEPIWAAIREGFARLSDLYVNQANQSLVNDVIDEVLAPHEGGLLTEELTTALSTRLADKIAERMTAQQNAQIEAARRGTTT